MREVLCGRSRYEVVGEELGAMRCTKEGEHLSRRREERNEPSETTELVKNGRNEKSQTCKISG